MKDNEKSVLEVNDGCIEHMACYIYLTGFQEAYQDVQTTHLQLSGRQ